MGAMTSLQLSLCGFYGIYGLVFFVVLCATLASHPLFPIRPEDAVRPPSVPHCVCEDQEERDALLASLRRRSSRLFEKLNALPGVRCPQVQGALYTFPELTMPAGALAKAKERGVAPDFLYCEELLDQTGICTVPGSGFGQQGQWHIRTTFCRARIRWML